jgi:enamine deaminase RidA (YjgF/YER057c/UK114 family)
MEKQIAIKHAPRNWSSLKRFAWSDQRPFVVYVDGQIAKDKKGNERRFSTAEGARKAFSK